MEKSNNFSEEEEKKEIEFLINLENIWGFITRQYIDKDSLIAENGDLRVSACKDIDGITLTIRTNSSVESMHISCKTKEELEYKLQEALDRYMDKIESDDLKKFEEWASVFGSNFKREDKDNFIQYYTICEGYHGTNFYFSNKTGRLLYMN